MLVIELKVNSTGTNLSESRHRIVTINDGSPGDGDGDGGGGGGDGENLPRKTAAESLKSHDVHKKPKSADNTTLFYY